MEIERRYRGRPALETLWPFDVNRHTVQAFCIETRDDREYDIPNITWARLTGGVSEF